MAGARRKEAAVAALISSAGRGSGCDSVKVTRWVCGIWIMDRGGSGDAARPQLPLSLAPGDGGAGGGMTGGGHRPTAAGGKGPEGDATGGEHLRGARRQRCGSVSRVY